MGMPRQDAEVLLTSGGGLPKQLEDVGWAACSLGANTKIMERALREAQQVEDKMSPGTTVVMNQVINQKLPGASRGDKLLWMQEHGLNGPSGPTNPEISVPNLV